MRHKHILAITATTCCLCACQWGHTSPADSATDTITTADANYVDAGVPLPLFLWYHNSESMNVVLWTSPERPEGGRSALSRRNLADWQRQESVRSHAREYNNIFFSPELKGRVHFEAETFFSPDSNALESGILHNRYFPAASIGYAFDNPKQVNVRDSNIGTMAVLTTDSYLASHHAVKLSHTLWHGTTSDKPLAAKVITQLEQQYQQKVQRSHLVCRAGQRYSYGIVQFHVADDHALALEVVTDGDSIYSLPVRGTNDPDSLSYWQPNDSAIYKPGTIVMAFEGPQGPEFCYEQPMSDGIAVGVMCIRDGQLMQRRQARYVINADEGNRRPLWHADFEQLQRLYAEASTDTADVVLTKWCWVDIDGDGYDELWLRSSDDRHGAFFTFRDDFKLVCCETPSLRPRLYVGRIRISRVEGGSSLYYANYVISKSQLLHTFEKTEVYGALRQATLDRRPLSQEECMDFQDKLPKTEHPLKTPDWHAIE